MRLHVTHGHLRGRGVETCGPYRRWKRHVGAHRPTEVGLGSPSAGLSRVSPHTSTAPGRKTSCNPHPKATRGQVDTIMSGEYRTRSRLTPASPKFTVATVL